MARRRPTGEEIRNIRTKGAEAVRRVGATKALGHLITNRAPATTSGVTVWTSSCACGWVPDRPLKTKAELTAAVTEHLDLAAQSPPAGPPITGPRPGDRPAAGKSRSPAKQAPGPKSGKKGSSSKKKDPRRGLPGTAALPVKPAAGWAKAEARAAAALRANAKAIDSTPRGTPGAKPSTYKLGASPSTGE